MGCRWRSWRRRSISGHCLPSLLVRGKRYSIHAPGSKAAEEVEELTKEIVAKCLTVNAYGALAE
jgi:hypothetical protein